MNVAPSAESSAEQPKEMSKSQLKKLAKQKNAKPKMSKEEKMKAVGCGEVVYYILVGTEGKCGCWRRKEDWEEDKSWKGEAWRTCFRKQDT